MREYEERVEWLEVSKSKGESDRYSKYIPALLQLRLFHSIEDISTVLDFTLSLGRRQPASAQTFGNMIHSLIRYTHKRGYLTRR